MEESKELTFPFKIIFKALVAIFFVACAFFALSGEAFAATTMYVSPASGSYAPGASFTANVYISTPADKPANAISSTISFPKDLLEVTSVSTGGSIVTLWVANPTYSNSSGSVHFEGVIVNPGYNGTAGKLVSITFKAKASGTANVTFPAGSILANDGLGTNILTGFGSGKYTVTGGEVPVPTPTPTPTPTPAPAPTTAPSAPVITSSTHPVPGAWVSGNDPVFSWKLPAGATGVNFIADHNATTDPGSVSDGVLSTYKYSDVDDGIWYMHLKFRNEIGWGAASHYKFQVDTLAPEPFEIDLLDGSDQSVVEPRISFFTKDLVSGVDQYIIKIDGVEVGRVTAADWTQASIFTLPAQTSGEKMITVEAVDKAGNTISTKSRFTVSLPVESAPFATDNAPAYGSSFPSLNFITLLACLLLLLALLFAAFVLWRSSRSWGMFLVGRRKNTLLRRLRKLRVYVARNFTALERDVVATNFTSDEKKTATRVAKNLRELQAELNKEIDYLSE